MDCTQTEVECDRRNARKSHEFNRFVDMINTLSVTCTEFNPEDSDDGNKKLPDWEWRVEGILYFLLNQDRVINYLYNHAKLHEN